MFKTWALEKELNEGLFGEAPLPKIVTPKIVTPENPENVPLAKIAGKAGWYTMQGKHWYWTGKQWVKGAKDGTIQALAPPAQQPSGPSFELSPEGTAKFSPGKQQLITPDERSALESQGLRSGPNGGVSVKDSSRPALIALHKILVTKKDPKAQKTASQLHDYLINPRTNI